MESSKPRYSPNEFAQKGQSYYEKKIKPYVTKADNGKFAAIDIETGDYEIDPDDYTVTDRLLIRQPNAQIWLCRIGQYTTYRMGGYPSRERS